ncbi:MAG TPA: serine hydrolase domain-containing protein [Candidatus Baltobacteraceae bacterium]|jgi:CubicO group peptidase (beta-lactamase class C family)
MNLSVDAAASYAQRHKPNALLIVRAGKTLLEAYAPAFDEEAPHALYSGTKAFWGVTALAAERDGLLHLDECVADTFAQWSDDARKRQVTLRQLLQLTAGIGFGGLGNAVPAYDRALAIELRNEPGTTFTYGGIPLQIFGAVLAQKLAARKRTPHEYLRERILDPIGVRIASWRTLKDGTQPLPTGAFLTAREWVKYGQYVAANARELASCFVGSHANPRYGLAWWLAPPNVPDDLVYASGAGGQALYVVPSLDLTIVRFGANASFKHEAFLKRLFGHPSTGSG